VLFLGVVDDALQALQPGFHSHLPIRCEMVPGVHDDPFRAELPIGVDIGREVLLDCIGHVGRIFRDVHCGKCVKAQMNPVLFACLPNPGGARVIETCQGIRGGVELDVDVPNIVSGRPLNSVFEPETASDIDPDPVS
jgi:hypothetical protein